MDLELTGDGPPVGQRVRDIPWPPSSLLLAIRRNGTSVVPAGETQLQKGDRLAILVPAEHAETVVDAVGMDRMPASRDAAESASHDIALESVLSQSPPGSVVLEPTVTSGSGAERKLVRDLGLERGILLVAIRRGETVLVPRGDTRLETGDRITLIAPSSLAERVRGLFRTQDGK